ncbi:MAG: sigma-70 family RNA polymerase sigma factor [Planctomycetes bacterium]|nr:sigma-70 family RNA polymerase sigma factor [Planctomycetota bacterium]
MPPAESTPDQSPGQEEFPVTAWSLVERAIADPQDAALNDLVGRYWRPIYVYLRRTNRHIPEAEDLTQGFFVHVIEKQLLERVRPREVRFRAYLRGLLEHYLANEARIARAAKRGRGFTFDIAGPEQWLEANVAESPDQAFDGVWAVERLDVALGRLRQELRQSGREWVADALLARSADDAVSVGDLAKKHGVTENVMSVALHRARKRLRELLLAVVTEAVGSREEAMAELTAMLGQSVRADLS